MQDARRLWGRFCCSVEEVHRVDDTEHIFFGRIKHERTTSREESCKFIGICSFAAKPCFVCPPHGTIALIVELQLAFSRSSVLGRVYIAILTDVRTGIPKVLADCVRPQARFPEPSQLVQGMVRVLVISACSSF